MTSNRIKAGKDCAAMILKGFAQSLCRDPSRQPNGENTADRGSRDEVEDFRQRLVCLSFELF